MHDEAALSAFCSHIAVQFFPEDQSFESVLGFVRNQMTLPEGVQICPCSVFDSIMSVLIFGKYRLVQH